jgi:hypothetical protein
VEQSSRLAWLPPGSPVAQLDGGVPNANQRVGSPLTVIAPGFTNRPRAYGTDRLENPTGIYTRYGYLNDGPAQTDKLVPTGGGYFFAPPGAADARDFVGSGLLV